MADTATDTNADTATIGELTSSVWWSASYPAKYYAYSNATTTLGGYPTVGWVDVSMFSESPSWLPPASGMIPLSQEEWDARQLVNQVVINGVVSTYTPPVPVIPLKDQAATALASARTYVNNTYTMLNEATPDAWVAYLKALMAIASGTDTTSTALPTAPTS